MTVKQLVARLKNFPDDWEVIVSSEHLEMAHPIAGIKWKLNEEEEAKQVVEIYL